MMDSRNGSSDRTKSRSIKNQLALTNQKLLFWFGCSAIVRFGQAHYEIDIAEYGPLPTGPKIFAANHPSTIDPIMLLALAPEQMSILVTGDVFKIPLFGPYLRAAGHIPVVRGRDREAFDEALRLLKAGRSIGIFPEGSLSPLGAEIGIGPARTGAVRLALESGAPIIPVGINLLKERIRFIHGKIDKTPGTARLYLNGPYAMTVGRPLRFSGNLDREGVKEASRQVIQRIAGLARESRVRMARTVIKGARDESAFRFLPIH
ncbi:MAG: 1-acyl-sn-glycerol-3-phosphate acyltransferase [Anaerolineales bacterium]|nr:1-acyl-sn-glycerol-3-phosphate acyltransferase [Anaerolineales bacterium]